MRNPVQIIPRKLLIIKIMLAKTSLLIILIVGLAAAQDCFGEACAHRSIRVNSSPPDYKEISTKIQAELRRQYWYYLRDSDLIYQANLELPARLIAFYFHRNIGGTFFTIASNYFGENRSEVNTLVRLGNGYPTSQTPGSTPATIEPFTLTLKTDSTNSVNVEMTDQGDMTANGQTLTNTLLDSGNEGNGDQANTCTEISDEILRKQYWYYLNDAKQIYSSPLVAFGREYRILAYINVVGTFLIITDCEGRVVTANTFVRLGRGSVDKDYIIVKDPTPLFILP